MSVLRMKLGKTIKGTHDAEVLEREVLPSGFYAWENRYRPGEFFVTEGHGRNSVGAGYVTVSDSHILVDVLLESPGWNDFKVALEEKYKDGNFVLHELVTGE